MKNQNTTEVALKERPDQTQIGFKYAVTEFRAPQFSMQHIKHGDVIDGFTMLRFDIHHEPIGVTNDEGASMYWSYSSLDRVDVVKHLESGPDECDVWARVLEIMDGGEL